MKLVYTFTDGTVQIDDIRRFLSLPPDKRPPPVIYVPRRTSPDYEMRAHKMKLQRILGQRAIYAEER